jgi:hypothetical protein
LLPFGSESFVFLPAVEEHKIIILPVVLYRCETWSLTLREQHRLRVFENRLLRRMFGAKRDEVMVEWRKVHNSEFHNLYSSPYIIRPSNQGELSRQGMWHASERTEKCTRFWWESPKERDHLEDLRRRWEDGIRMDLREIGWWEGGVVWIHLAHDRDGEGGGEELS